MDVRSCESRAEGQARANILEGGRAQHGEPTAVSWVTLAARNSSASVGTKRCLRVKGVGAGRMRQQKYQEAQGNTHKLFCRYGQNSGQDLEKHLSP